MTSVRARPLVLGLVGGIASGKSAVADAFERRGCVVSRSDSEVHALLERPEIVEKIRVRFGSDVMREDGAIDRRALGTIVFADAEARRWLEGLLHPLLHASRQALLERAHAEGARVFVIDAPLLFEAGVDAECDAVVFVACDRAERLRRVETSRGWDEAELARRENAQMGLDVKRQKADYVVENDGGLDLLDRQVAILLQRLLAEPSL